MNFKLLSISFFICSLIAIFCSLFGQLLLIIVNINIKYYSLLFILAFPVLALTKKLNTYFNTSHVNISYLLEPGPKIISLFFPFIILINTLGAHLSGMSVGREGVSVQIGGSFGATAGNYFKLSQKEKDFLVYLGMVSGFASLFHTCIAAAVFIVELVYYKNKKLPSLTDFVLYLLFAFYSSSLSLFIGLDKFHEYVNNYKLEFIDYLKIIIFTILVIFLAIIFVRVQKKVKSFNEKYKIVLLLAVLVFILFSEGRYNSLGTNFINSIFEGSYDFRFEDFILKIIITIVCTGIGFSGGEVTNLFAIGSLFGVLFATMYNLPILVIASLGYVLMFCASARVFLTAILIALEVFGMDISFIIIIPSLLIPLLNKKFSIY